MSEGDGKRIEEMLQEAMDRRSRAAGMQEAVRLHLPGRREMARAASALQKADEEVRKLVILRGMDAC